MSGIDRNEIVEGREQHCDEVGAATGLGLVDIVEEVMTEEQDAADDQCPFVRQLPDEAEDDHAAADDPYHLPYDEPKVSVECQTKRYDHHFHKYQPDAAVDQE